MRKHLFYLLCLWISFTGFGQLLQEKFEGTTFPPSGWTINQSNPTNTWVQIAGVNGWGTGKAAAVEYDPSLIFQDEWLISPSLDLSSANEPVLSVAIGYSYYWSVAPNDNYDVYIKVSTDDGTTWTTIWDGDDADPFEPPFQLIPLSLPLTDFIGESNVKIAFQYYGVDGAGLYLDSIAVLDGDIVYCEPATTSTNYEFITNVTFAGINNSTGGTPGLNDYTGQVAEVTAGTTEPISITIDTDASDYLSVFIDWNQNGTLNDEGEVYVLAENVGEEDVLTFTQDINIPADALEGPTRMRVVQRYDGVPTPCDSYYYGEIEDYTVNVTTGGTGPEYCEPATISTNYEFITNVTFAGINNSTGGTPGLNDYTDQVAEVTAGTSEPISITIDTDEFDYLSVFIDWNQNGTLDDEGEIYVLAEEVGDSNVLTFTDDIAVPADALEGPTRMRVVQRYDGVPTPCDSYYYGEIEDYTVMVNNGGTGTGSGNTCEDAKVVTSLPYDDAGNTADYGNDYGSTDVPELAPGAVTNGTGAPEYLNGDDVVYAYTPTEDQFLNVSTTNDDSWIGLWAFTGCPFDSTVGYHTGISGATRAISGLFVTAGETYYFVISSWPSPQSTEYTIHIEAIAACEGTPEGGTATVDPTSGPSGATAHFTVSGYSTEAGITYDWEYSVNGGEWESVGTGLDDVNLIVTGEQGDEFTVRYAVTCNISGETAYSSEVVYTIDETNCTPTFTASTDFIVNFGLEDIQNNDSGQSAGGYGDYTSMSTDLNAGQVYTATLTSSSGSGSHGAAVWIDFDDSGIFDDSEKVGYLDGIYPDETHDISLTIPDGVSGEHRLRVIYQYNTAGQDIIPCASATYGEGEDYTVNIIGSTGGGEDCEQGDNSNNFETGFQIGTGTDFENADDFFVSAGNTLNVQMIEFNVVSGYGPMESIGFTFYNDEGGSPGSTVVNEVTGLVPDEQVLIGYAGIYEVYAIYVSVDLSFAGGEDGAHYWMQPMAVAPDSQIGGYWWEMTSLGELGDPVHTRVSGGAWEADPDSFDGVFKLHCEPIEPPCHYNILINVEPITKVNVADINNTSDATVNGSPALEDFTSIEGHMTPGESYEIALEGNTDGNFVDYFTVFVDWNQNGNWTDAGEMYEIGSISNSTGLDGQQATGTITVPADALEGSAVMRVVKNYDVSPTNPCMAYFYGQAEDYTIIVGNETQDYCEPSLDCTDGDLITNVTFADVNNNSDCSPNGYGDYTDMIASVEAGSMNDISVTVGDGWPYESVSVWIDYNNNFVFDEDEFTYIGTGTAGAVTGSVMIPAVVPDGQYRMRVRVAAVGEGSATWDMSCDEDQVYGETEDYTVNVGELGVSDINSFDFTYYPNPVKDVLNIEAKKSIENISVHNLAGQAVMQGLKAADGKVNMSGLTPGVYVFRVTLQGGQVETFKIIKK